MGIVLSGKLGGVYWLSSFQYIFTLEVNGRNGFALSDRCTNWVITHPLIHGSSHCFYTSAFHIVLYPLSPSPHLFYLFI